MDELIAEDMSATERTLATAEMLLERYGVVSREASGAESLPGGFAPLHRALSSMEDGGRVRRGYFVEGLAGAQFARSGVVDRLRVGPPEGEDQGTEVRVLAALDPASPWGALLPWPDAGRQDGVRARRVPGAWVFTMEGAPVLYLAANLHQLVTFPETTRDDAALTAAIAALAEFPQRLRRGSLTIVKVDGEPVTESPLLRPMLECGFVRDYRGLVIERDYRR